MVETAAQLANILRLNLQLLKAFFGEKMPFVSLPIFTWFYFCPVKTFLTIANYLRNETELVIVSVLAILIFLPEKLSKYLLCDKGCLLIKVESFFFYWFTWCFVSVNMVIFANRGTGSWGRWMEADFFFLSLCSSAHCLRVRQTWAPNLILPRLCEKLGPNGLSRPQFSHPQSANHTDTLLNEFLWGWSANQRIWPLWRAWTPSSYFNTWFSLMFFNGNIILQPFLYIFSYWTVW